MGKVKSLYCRRREPERVAADREDRIDEQLS
jgi:hypothetical protein